MQGRRSLTSVKVARWPLPWRWRRRAVLIEIRRRSDAHLAARLGCIEHATVVRRQTEKRQVLSTDLPVWQFWAPDPERAPALVRSCMHSVTQHLSDRTVTVLDPASYGEFVGLPQYIEARREQMGWTHFSDLLRIWLLAEHGGTWIDATVMMSAPMPKQVDEAPFFAFSRPGGPVPAVELVPSRPARPSDRPGPARHARRLLALPRDLGGLLPAALHVRERRDGGPTTTPDVDGRSGPQLRTPAPPAVGARLGVRRARPAGDPRRLMAAQVDLEDALDGTRRRTLRGGPRSAEGRTRQHRLNRIECHLWAFAEFVVEGSDYPDWVEFTKTTQARSSAATVTAATPASSNSRTAARSPELPAERSAPAH